MSNKQIVINSVGEPSDCAARSVALATRLTVIAVLALGAADSVWAYLDPGTGSIILQGLVAGVAAAIAYAGMYWQRVKNSFRALFGSRRSDLSESPEPDDRSV